MAAFIPLSDELLYDHPEFIPADGSARLVPFHLDLVEKPPGGGAKPGSAGCARSPESPARAVTCPRRGMRKDGPEE